MKNIGTFVLTGATGGIGYEIAHALTGEGYRLLLVGRSEDKLGHLLSSFPGAQVQHEKIIADLTKQKDIDKLRSRVEGLNAENSGVIGLINCLGTNSLSTLQGTSEASISNIIATNLLAPINVCKALLPSLERQSEAVIVNVGSILGSIGYAGSTTYCASKFGLRGFTESLRRELADTNVSVIYLAPRAVDTALNTKAMNEMNKELGNSVDEPEKVADQLIRALASGKPINRYLGWPESFFVRLNSLFPSLVDKALAKQLPTIKRYCKV